MLTGVGKLPLVPILPSLVTGPVPPPVFPCDLGGQQNGRGKGRGSKMLLTGDRALPSKAALSC